MCERERCPFAIVGVATDAPALVLEDGPGGERVIDMPMDVLLGKPPRMHRDVKRVARSLPALELTGVCARTGGLRRAAPPDRGLQALPGHHRRPAPWAA